MALRLRSLSVVFGGGSATVELSEPQHLVVAPERLRARALRDAALAVLHGPGLFPGARRAGIRRADLRFEVNGIRYRCGVDFAASERRLVMVDPSGVERAVAQRQGPVAQMLAPLLHLPSALIYRTLALVGTGATTGPLRAPPGVPRALRPALLRHLDAPEAEAEALAVARAAVDELTTRRAAIIGEGGALDVVFRRAAKRREAELGELDAALRVAQGAAASLEAEHAAVSDLMSRFEAEAGDRHRDVARRAARPRPDPDVVDHVEIFVGDPPEQAAIDEVMPPLELAGDVGASAAQILAAGLLREGRTPPILWLGDTPIPVDRVDWAALWGILGDRQSVLVFVDGEAPAAGRPVPMVLEATR